MDGKVPPDPEPLTRTEGEGATLDMPEGVRGFVPGQVLGERYQIVEMLGRGGMGEVWHAFDPLGRWVASGANDGTARLWPMPDLSMPPLHTLPREELIARLKTLTNLRVSHDEEGSTGWKVDYALFPGWAEVPEW